MKLKRKDSDLKQTVAQAQGAQTRLKYSNADRDNIQKKNIPHCHAVRGGPHDRHRVLRPAGHEMYNAWYRVVGTREAERVPPSGFQEISRLESELTNLDSQIRMQQESVEAKEAEMKSLRDQIDQVLHLSDSQSDLAVVYLHHRVFRDTLH